MVLVSNTAYRRHEGVLEVEYGVDTSRLPRILHINYYPQVSRALGTVDEGDDRESVDTVSTTLISTTLIIAAENTL